MIMSMADAPKNEAGAPQLQVTNVTAGLGKEGNRSITLSEIKQNYNLVIIWNLR
jgi:hypothetical protein